METLPPWLDFARHCPSPNWDERPRDSAIDLLVIHNISLPPGDFGGPWIEALFTNRLDPTAHTYFEQIHQLKVSSHLLIRRDGKLVQFVALDKRAWHAGPSCFRNRESCNDFSIGIELEGTDDIPYTDAQYLCLTKLTRRLQQSIPTLTRDTIVGHCDIAPGRKTDPGPAFDWQRYFDLLQHP